MQVILLLFLVKEEIFYSVFTIMLYQKRKNSTKDILFKVLLVFITIEKFI